MSKYSGINDNSKQEQESNKYSNSVPGVKSTKKKSKLFWTFIIILASIFSIFVIAIIGSARLDIDEVNASVSVQSVQSSTSSVQSSTSQEPGFIELVSYFETALERKTGKNVKPSLTESDWQIEKTYLRYVMHSSNVKINNINHDVIMKIEFDDNTYKTYKVFQLKIDDKNIDL